MNEESVLRILYANAVPMSINQIGQAYGRARTCGFDYALIRKMHADGKLRIVHTPEKLVKYLPVDPIPPWGH